MPIVRIPIRNPAFEMEGVNNAYLVLSGDAVAIVDGGVPDPVTRREIEDALAARDLAVEDVDHVFLTHWHPDHAGAAAFVQERSGAAVHVHEADAPLVEGDPAAYEDLTAAYMAAFDAWGMPPRAYDAVAAGPGRDPEERRDAGGPVAVQPFVGGETFEIGDLAVRAVHAPGHTAGETVFAVCDGRREAFTGDALLPEYTPNVGGADPRLDDALERHLDTLSRIADGAYERALPGHREPIDAPEARAAEVIRHHRIRAAEIVALLEAEGPLGTWEVTVSLFDELRGHHTFLAAGETDAHLAYLTRAGILAETEDGYRTTGVEGLDGLFGID